MKLNKYIYEQLERKQIRFLENEDITEDDIEDWIVEWYNDTFKQVGNPTKGRGPPMWLAGPRWYDRKKRKMEENESTTDSND